MTCNDCIHAAVCADRADKFIEIFPTEKGVETVCEHFEEITYHVGNIGNIGLKTPLYTPPPMPKIKPRQQTNADRIRAMSDDHLREFLEDVANSGGETMWCKQFSEKFCDSCPTVTGKIEGYNKEMEFHECEFADGKCPHGNELDWWLRQPAKEET